jgi:protein RecA
MPSEITSEFIKDIRKEITKAKVEGINITTGADIQLASHIPFAIPSGLPQLELCIGKPGYPAGRILEFFGFPASGKTTAALHALASCQRIGGKVMYIDAENSWDPVRAKKCGIVVEDLMLVEATSIEKIFDGISYFLNALESKNWRQASMVVVDSITSVESEGNEDKAIREESRVAQDARIIRRALRKLAHRIAELKMCAIFINHAISNIGFGDPKTSGGGNALKFFASLRVDFTFRKSLVDGKKGEERSYEGQEVEVAIRKNKINITNSPEFLIRNGPNGFDIYDGLLAGFINLDVVEVMNQKTYHYKPTNTTFSRSEWKALVHGIGGPECVYDFFLKKAEELGKITPYGVDADEIVIITEPEKGEEE